MRTVSKHSVNFLTKRGEEKTGRKTRRKKKGGAPRAPTKPKGGEARTRGRRGGERKNTFRLGQARAQVLDKCSRTALLA